MIKFLLIGLSLLAGTMFIRAQDYSGKSFFNVSVPDLSPLHKLDFINLSGHDSNRINFYKPRPRFSKKRFAANAIFLEAFGFGGKYTPDAGYVPYTNYTVNYDLILQSSEVTALTGRIGFGTNGDNVVVPLLVNLLIGKNNSAEIGGGAVYIDRGAQFNPAINIGFRHQRFSSGFMFRLVFISTLETTYTETGAESARNITLSAGLGLGWSL